MTRASRVFARHQQAGGFTIRHFWGGEINGACVETRGSRWLFFAKPPRVFACLTSART
jgi:hypothetical protein